MQQWASDDMVVCQVGGRAIGVWNWQTGQQLYRLTCGSVVTYLAVACPSGLVAITPEHAGVHVWEPVRGNLTLLSSGHHERRGALVFDIQWARLAEGRTARVRIWAVATAQPVLHLHLHPESGQSSSASALALQPTGTLLAAGMFRGRHPVTVWDLATGGFLQPLDEADPIVNELTFSPDGHWLAAESDDHGVGLTLWRVTGQ